ncbi:hypothetical protein QFZ20_004596 [Flavobacterium sp. W4I14]|nr:hypothetical protein [Flavobacterium sp. W4I14]
MSLTISLNNSELFLFLQHPIITFINIMNRILLVLSLLSISSALKAQSASDYNYSVGIKAFSTMQMPKILNQTSAQDYINTYGNGIMVKFNDNQISYRIHGNYFKDAIKFDHNYETANGTVTDYSFKIGFEKNFTYSRVQPYFAFDLGYRSNRFTGQLQPNAAAVINRNADVSKSGLVVSPVIGLKVSIIPQLLLFAESNLDFYFSYERQDISDPNGASRTVNTYNKLESLLNPISAGLQFQISRKN